MMLLKTSSKYPLSPLLKKLHPDLPPLYWPDLTYYLTKEEWKDGKEKTHGSGDCHDSDVRPVC